MRERERERMLEKDKHYFLCIFLLQYPFPLFWSLHIYLSKEKLHINFGVFLEHYEKKHHLVVCIPQSLPTKLLGSELSRIFCHMNVSVVVNMDASPKSLNDACMVEPIVSPQEHKETLLNK